MKKLKMFFFLTIFFASMSGKLAAKLPYEHLLDVYVPYCSFLTMGSKGVSSIIGTGFRYEYMPDLPFTIYSKFVCNFIPDEWEFSSSVSLVLHEEEKRLFWQDTVRHGTDATATKVDCTVQSVARYMLELGIRKYATIPYTDTMLVAGFRYLEASPAVLDEYPRSKINASILLPLGRNDCDGDFAWGLDVSFTLYKILDMGFWGTDKGFGMSLSINLSFVDWKQIGLKL